MTPPDNCPLGREDGSSVAQSDGQDVKSQLNGEWLPIETAPKDEMTRVLLAPHMVTGWRDGDKWLIAAIPTTGDGAIAPDWLAPGLGWTCIHADVTGIEPTHWMPLPDLPTA